MDTFIPLCKQSKRARKAFYASRRGTWNGLSPVTRIAPSRKAYDRRRIKAADRAAKSGAGF